MEFMDLYTVLSVVCFCLSIGGTLFINFKRRIGFISCAFGNVCWIILYLMSVPVNYVQIASLVIYALLNLQGYLRSRRADLCNRQ